MLISDATAAVAPVRAYLGQVALNGPTTASPPPLTEPAAAERLSAAQAGRTQHDVEIGPLLRRVRTHLGLSLREVERRTGRTNAYLSQLERGVIRRPDPLVVLQLCELYRLDFSRVAGWIGLDAEPLGPARSDDYGTLSALLRVAADLHPDDRAELLRVAERLRRGART